MIDYDKVEKVMGLKEDLVYYVPLKGSPMDVSTALTIASLVAQNLELILEGLDAVSMEEE